MPRLLGIDPGQRYVGISISDEKKILASPLKTIDLKETEEPLEKLQAIPQKYDIEKVIVGYPEPFQTSENERTRQVDNFIESFVKPLELPHETVSERYTTKQAKKLRQERKKNSNSEPDSEAAALILQYYLESLKN